MCGILGVISKKDINSELKEKFKFALKSLQHRGPDYERVYSQDRVLLGHTRLAIIDLSAVNNQPLTCKRTGRTIIFNGEIYNFREIRKKLQVQGISFDTQGDTEVILRGVEFWGDRFISELKGMFAFAITDRDGSLILARDRFGEKPMFLFESQNLLIFGSEVSTILQLVSSNEKELDFLGVNQFLRLNYVPGNRTLVKNLRKVNPGTFVKISPQLFKTEHTFWKPPSAKSIGKELRKDEDVLTELEARIDKAVSDCIVSDVPISVFLSGGIDSALIAESATRIGGVKQSFTIDFDESHHSEWSIAKTVAKKVGLNSTRVPLNSKVLDFYLQIIDHSNDPLGDSSAIPVWVLSQATRNEFKVALSGDGGDELFCGYLTYLATSLHQNFIVPLPDMLKTLLHFSSTMIPINGIKKVSFSYKLKRFLRSSKLSTPEAHLSWNGAWSDSEIKELLNKQFYHFEPLAEVLLKTESFREFPHDFQILDIQNYLSNDILSKVDRMSMAHSLEVRSPYLHPEISEFALGLQTKFRTSKKYPLKHLLRLLAEKKFGKNFASQKKQGFSIPIHSWLRERSDILLDVINHEELKSIPFLNANVIINLRDKHLNGTRHYGFELWGLIVLLRWLKQQNISG